MINIQVERDCKGQVTRVLVAGHANFARYGQDIVCAAVSGITIGLVNAMETMFGVQMHANNVDDDGRIDCYLPHLNDSEQVAKIRLLMEALVISLKNVANEYPDYVKIREIREEKL